MLLAPPALAQNTTGMVVSSCGTLGTAYGPAGRAGPPTVDLTGRLCTSGSVSGTVTATQSGAWTVQPGNTANTTPWLVTLPAATLTDRSGTITSGGDAQQLAAANASRHGFMMQNTSIGELWINELGGTASAASPSIRISAGQLYESPLGATSVLAISIFGATTAQTFTAREW